ncbi:alpha/beta hydrolase [Mesorhizobium sp. BR1-1-16]|uniref:alpha/beta fold hydrolase n=1 Tax=Mesorhizobium sp. BR1-1-16 TaxID=2876653 RepID=UPI001CCE4170|nr:alpha/beta hydrolase [Mesorhizobium sp. BR1-1-16]MBZ9935554.1 alpha/beta hydrolase [Mesorhizobium sp. BR1-1-16]
MKKMQVLAGSAELAFTDLGNGAAILLLHGGAGPASMVGLAEALSASHRLILPVHPGFDERPRPEWLHTIHDLATIYLALIERLDLPRVTLVGNSAGGWIAAEMALRRSPRIAGIVLLNAVGIDPKPTGKPIVDPLGVPPAERATLAFHDPATFAAAPQTPEALERLRRNQQALMVYAGDPFMHDPTLRDRLARLDVPAMVLWGASDRIVEIEYGLSFAASMPGARFETVAEAGHFPQIEKLDLTSRLVAEFADGQSQSKPF